MGLINPKDLVAQFESYLKNNDGYIWGTAGLLWTEARQKQKVNYMVNKYGPNWINSDKAKEDNYYMAARYGSKWVGHIVEDCSGAFTRAFKALGGEMYHGSNTMWNSWCTAKGELKNGRRTDGKELLPGTAIFTYNKKTGKRGHVGLYVGNGEVIEAKGTQAGVTSSKVTDSKWVEWGELKGVDYGAEPQPEPQPPTPTPEPEKGEAVVTGKRVALRYGPTTSAGIITRVNTGEIVKIAEPPKDWEYVTYNGKSGYMMKEFIKEG